MKVLPGHYKGPQATSKGHAPLLIPVATMGKCKQANEFQLCHYGHLTLLIIHEQNRPDSRLKVVLPILTCNQCHRFGMHAGTNQVWTFTVALSLIEKWIVSDLKALTRFYMQACNEYNKTNIVLIYTVGYQVYYTS